MILKAETCHRDIWKHFIHSHRGLLSTHFPVSFQFYIYHAPAVLSTVLLYRLVDPMKSRNSTLSLD